MKTQTIMASLLLAVSGFAANHTRAELKPGTLAEPWLTGGPNCLTVPDW